MTHDEIMEAFNKITYKDNYYFMLLRCSDRDAYECKIWVKVKHRDSKEEISIVSTSIFDTHTIRDASDLIRFIYYQTKKSEEHETDEWFKFNGERIYDPHKNDPEIYMI